MGLSKFFRGKKAASAPEPDLNAPAKPEYEQDLSAPEPPSSGASKRTFTSEEIEQAVIEVLHTVYDPEIPVDIYELGLVYSIDVDPAGKVLVNMTLTSPGCPVAGSLPYEVESKVRLVPGVTDAKVVIVWDPPWDPNMMTEAAKLQLGF